MTALSTYLHKLDDILRREDLTDPAEIEQFYHRLLAYWTGQLRRATRPGTVPTGFTPLEISELITTLENRIYAHRSDTRTPAP